MFPKEQLAAVLLSLKVVNWCNIFRFLTNAKGSRVRGLAIFEAFRIGMLLVVRLEKTK